MNVYCVEEKDFTKTPSLSYEKYFPKKEIAKNEFCSLLEKVADKYEMYDLYGEQRQNEIFDGGYFAIIGKVEITLKVKEVKKVNGYGYLYDSFVYDLKNRFIEDKIVFNYIKDDGFPSSFTPSTFGFSRIDIGRAIFRDKEAYSSIVNKLKKNDCHLISSCIGRMLADNCFYEDDFAISVIPLYSEIKVNEAGKDIFSKEDLVDVIVPYVIDTELLYNSIKEYYNKNDWGDFKIY